MIDISYDWPMTEKSDEQEGKRYIQLSFGEALKHLREGQGLTQKELARMVGISQNRISAYESQREGLRDIHRLISLADALHVDKDDLRAGRVPVLDDQALSDMYGVDWKEKAMQEIAPHVTPRRSRQTLEWLDQIPNYLQDFAIASLRGIAMELQQKAKRAGGPSGAENGGANGNGNGNGVANDTEGGIMEQSAI